MVQDVYLDNKYDAFSPENSLRTHSDRPGRDAERLKLISVRSDSSLSKHADLTTLSSYYTYDLDYSYDGDWGNAQYWGENAPYDYFSQTGRARNVFAQLIQLSSPTRSAHDLKGWNTGIYYQSFDEQGSIDEYSNT